jgi:predicted nucleic acid-binding protein
MVGVTLDAGALIAIERGDRRLQALLDEAGAVDATIAVPAGVIAQAWRGSKRQARLARFLGLSNVTAVALDEPAARAAGSLCGLAGTADIVDASVVICARERGQAVMTADEHDLRALDGQLPLIAV